MEIDQIMRQYGFSRPENDGYYLKEVNYDGEPAFIYITGLKVWGVPETLDEPILAIMYDHDFDEIRQPVEVESLRTYIRSLNGIAFSRYIVPEGMKEIPMFTFSLSTF